MMKMSAEHAEAVASTFALIAYPKPADCPLSHLLTLQVGATQHLAPSVCFPAWKELLLTFFPRYPFCPFGLEKLRFSQVLRNASFFQPLEGHEG